MMDMDLILSIIISLILCLILFQYYKNKKIVKNPIFYIIFLIISFGCVYLTTKMISNDEFKNIMRANVELQKPMNTGEPSF